MLGVNWLGAALSAAQPVDFSSQISPVLSKNCYHCHGPDEESRKAGLRLDLREIAVAPNKEGRFAIKPGDPSQSELIARVTATDPDEIMPPPKHGHALKSEEIAVLRQWIAEGAEYRGHWAFEVPKRPTPPTITASAPPLRSAIDSFIFAKLAAEGLSFSPEADKGTLARRVALDLTGLPPNWEDFQAFLRDDSADAYEKFVDKLLASPAYGERWARVWLDLARYADSAGYGSDPLRLNIWPYRDWLIAALNQNVPYDRFTIEQLAGDLLPNATENQILATAFHRNTMTNTEGGTDDEEWRVAAVKDRTHVTLQVWMGLTMGCAQCHTHKFDPISQKEFYSTYALFNQSEDADRADEEPTLPLPSPEDKEKSEQLKAEIAALEHELEQPTQAFNDELAAWEKAQSRVTKWSPLKPSKVHSDKGVKLSVEPDGSIFAEPAESDTHTIEFSLEAQKITAIRLDALTDDRIPAKGPGHSPANFVLSEFGVSVKPTHAGGAKSARFVRVDLPGKRRYLHLAEVEVFSGGQNIARKGKASQSSTDFGGKAEFANDGNTDGTYQKNSVSHTAGEDNPWWEVDLGAEFPVDSITVWNRTDGDTADRTTNFSVTLLNAARQQVYSQKQSAAPKPSATFSINGAQTLAWKRATADFSQTDWIAPMAIDGDPKTGWAIAPETGQPHVIVFELAAPFSAEGPTTLTATLAQLYGKNHVLGRYSLSVTNDAEPVLPLPRPVQAVLAVAPEQRSEAQWRELREHFRPFSKTMRQTHEKIAALKKKLEGIRPVKVPVMRELDVAKQRKTHLLNKGNFLDPGEEVSPGVPAAFGKFPEGAPMNRLGLAQWLFSPENPLTARVAVNRYWAQLFGTGLVESEEDFGTQGTLPSHPELLDWLAVEFRDKHWDVKALLKLIVTSTTYRQSSAVSGALLEKDPKARLLSRYPRRRLDAEQVRDQALALSGLLSRKLGGPSVYPPQPDGLWKAAFNGERTYPTSTGEDKYRRGLYTIWRRTIPYPSMATFDAPSRESCTVRRVPTNTPLQAYVTMNDPVFVECAQALGRRIFKEGGNDTASRLRFALTLVLARNPSEENLAALAKLYESEIAWAKSAPSEAQKLATEPIGPLPEGLTVEEAAAWTAIGNVLLNLDGVLMKG